MMLFAATAMAASLTGVVTNRTTGKPSAGDTIAVINTAQSMDEIAKATSDAEGRFQVNAPDGGQTLLHVTHRGAEYFKSVPPGASSVAIDVYDAAAKIDGISGEATVLRAETDASGKTLNLAENFFVQNASAPPRTQYGGNTLDFYLPKGAVIVQTLASSPGGLPTNCEVKTLDAANGHYAFTFPVRPGETRFQVAYSLPYNGRQAFSLKLTMPTGDFAVMLPKTGSEFQGSAQFQPLNQDTHAQSYNAHQPALPPWSSASAARASCAAQEDAQGAGSQSATARPPTARVPAAGWARRSTRMARTTRGKYKWWVLGAGTGSGRRRGRDAEGWSTQSRRRSRRSGAIVRVSGGFCRSHNADRGLCRWRGCRACRGDKHAVARAQGRAVCAGDGPAGGPVERGRVC